MAVISNSGVIGRISGFRIAIWVVVGLMAILSLGAIFVYAPVTMVRWWLPMSGALLLAGVSGITLWRIWRRLTGTESFTPNFLLNLIFFTLFLTALFYGLNASTISSGPPRKERVTVESKYRERHHTSRRTGRHSYTQGPDYYTYHVKVAFPGGETHSLELPYSTYKNIRKDSPLTLSLRRGLFGLDVIRISDIATDNPAPPKKRNERRCRFFGTSGRKHR